MAGGGPHPGDSTVGSPTVKTRTLLLLSVATALLILVAGGVFLVQLANQTDTVPAGEVGVSARVGDATIVVLDSDERAPLFGVDIEIGGVDDADGLDNVALVTGDRRLAPLAATGRARFAEG